VTRKICNAEADSAARMQCKRDAQSEHDKAVAAAKAQLSASGQPVAAKPVCADCGKVVAVQQVEKKGEGSAVGLVSGAVVGAFWGIRLAVAPERRWRQWRAPPVAPTRVGKWKRR
jgi:hypothetical protein